MNENMSQYSPADQMRVKQQEASKIKNHYLGDKTNMPSPLIIQTHVPGKIWFLQDSNKLNFLRIRVDVEIKVYKAKQYLVEIELLKHLLTIPSFQPGFEDVVLAINEMEPYSDMYKLNNFTYNTFADTWMEFNTTMYEALIDVFRKANDIFKENQPHIQTDFENDKGYTLKDITAEETDDMETRSQKKHLRKLMISAYNNIYKPYMKAAHEQAEIFRQEARDDKMEPHGVQVKPIISGNNIINLSNQVQIWLQNLGLDHEFNLANEAMTVRIAENEDPDYDLSILNTFQQNLTDMYENALVDDNYSENVSAYEENIRLIISEMNSILPEDPKKNLINFEYDKDGKFLELNYSVEFIKWVNNWEKKELLDAVDKPLTDFFKKNQDKLDMDSIHNSLTNRLRPLRTKIKTKDGIALVIKNLNLFLAELKEEDVIVNQIKDTEPLPENAKKVRKEGSEELTDPEKPIEPKENPPEVPEI